MHERGDFGEIANDESEGAGISTNGLVLGKDENLVDFGFSVVNVNARSENKQGDGTSTSESAQFEASSGYTPNSLKSIGPSHREFTVAGGSPNNYVLFDELGGTNYRINKPLSFYLQVDANLLSTGLKPSKVLEAADLAQDTWDHWISTQRLFKGTTRSTNSLVDVKDGKNVIGFLGFDDPGVAFARTYFKPSGKKFFVTESDISFSQRVMPGYIDPTNLIDYGGWTTDYAAANDLANLKLDFQSVLLHELGHTSGLADLYLLPASDPRHGNREVMNGGDLWVDHISQHNLGKGDITGLRKIYGDKPIWN